MHIYERYSGTAWELKTTMTSIEGSSIRSAAAAGSRIGVHGTVGLVASVRIGGNGIVRGATIVQMGSTIHARDAEVFRNHVTHVKGMTYENCACMTIYLDIQTSLQTFCELSPSARRFYPNNSSLQVQGLHAPGARPQLITWSNRLRYYRILDDIFLVHESQLPDPGGM